MVAASLPENEDGRLTALREYRILDTDPEDAYDDVVRLAAFVCGTPIAAITLIDAERQWFKSILGLSAAETPRDVAFCAHTILQPDVMVVPDALEDARFADNPLVRGDPGIRFYAGAPLVTSGGFALGSLCVIDRVPRHLTHDQEAALRTLARQVTNQIELTRRSFTQEQMIADRQQVEDALRQSTEELSAVVEQAMDGIFVFDPASRRLLKTNATFRAMLGYSEEQAIALTLYDLVGDDRESVDQNVRAVVRDKEVDLGERHYLRRNGSVAALEVRARIIRPSPRCNPAPKGS
jgi:PAS domain S-box-containing protein